MGLSLLVACRVGVVGNLEGGRGLVVFFEREVDADAVGATFLFAHRIGVGDGEAPLEKVEGEVVLGREGHVGSVIDADVGQRRGLLLGEDVCLFAGFDLRNVLPCGFFLRAVRRQRGEVLAEVLFQFSLVVVANDDGLERGGVAEPLPIDLEYAVVVGMIERFLQHGSHARVVVVEDGAYGIVVIDLGRRVAIGEERTVALDEFGEGLVVLSRLSEVEVGQLEHGFHVFDRC